MGTASSFQKKSAMRGQGTNVKKKGEKSTSRMRKRAGRESKKKKKKSNKQKHIQTLKCDKQRKVLAFKHIHQGKGIRDEMRADMVDTKGIEGT